MKTGTIFIITLLCCIAAALIMYQESINNLTVIECVGDNPKINTIKQCCAQYSGFNSVPYCEEKLTQKY